MMMPRPVRHFPASVLIVLLVAPLLSVFLGCPSKTAMKGTEDAAVLELSFTVASLDLSDLNRRLTKADVNDLWSALKKEKVEVLTVQNLTRYPGLSTRTDIVSELTALSDWRSVFGEMVDNSGRQTGNAVFASYPIRSHATVPFQKVNGAVFEGALHAVIDGGVREIIVVSAVYPAKGGDAVKDQCRTIVAEARGNPNAPMILTGKNPGPGEGWEEAVAGGTSPGIQYDGAGSMRVLGSRSAKTKLGTLTVVSFGLYRATTP